MSKAPNEGSVYKIDKLIKRDEHNKIVDIMFDLEQMKIFYDLENLSTKQVMVFRSLCIQYNLDPLLKHIYAWESKKRLVIHIGLNGWLEIANRSPQFDGIDKGVVYKGDKWIKLPFSKYEHEIGDGWGNPDLIRFAYAVCHRKDRKVPSLDLAFWRSYKKNMDKDWSTWKKFPEEMILKVAISRAIREAFSNSYMPESDTIVVDEEGKEVELVASEVIETDIEPEKTTPDSIEKRITKVFNLGLNAEEIETIGRKVSAELKVSKLTLSQYDKKYPGNIDQLITHEGELILKV